jgi:hypothetical protein
MIYKKKTFNHTLSRMELINYPAYYHSLEGDAEIAFMPDSRWLPLQSHAKGHEGDYRYSLTWELTKYSCLDPDCTINDEYPKVCLVYQIKGGTGKSYTLFHDSFFEKLRFWYGQEFDDDAKDYAITFSIVTRPFTSHNTYSSSGKDQELCGTYVDDIQIMYFGDTSVLGNYESPDSHRHIVDQTSNTMFLKFYVNDATMLEDHINVLLAHGFKLCSTNKFMKHT